MKPLAIGMIVAMVASQLVVFRAWDYELTVAGIVGLAIVFSALFSRYHILRWELLALAIILLGHGLFIVGNDASALVDALRTTVLWLLGAVQFLIVIDLVGRSTGSRRQVHAATSGFLVLLAIFSAIQVSVSMYQGQYWAANLWGARQWHGGIDLSQSYGTWRAVGWYLEPSHLGLLASFAGISAMATAAQNRGKMVPFFMAATVVLLSQSALAAGVFLATAVPLAMFDIKANRFIRTRATWGLLTSFSFVFLLLVMSRLAELRQLGSSGNFRFVQPAVALVPFISERPFGAGLGQHFSIVSALGFSQIGQTGGERFGLDNLWFQVAYGFGALAVFPLLMLVMVLAGTPYWCTAARFRKGLAAALCVCFASATGAVFNPELLLPFAMAIGAILAPEHAGSSSEATHG